MSSLQNADLSSDQQRVFSACVDWLRNPTGQFLSIGGYAGTGKTTLITVIRKYLATHDPKKRVAFACFTGRASQNLGTTLKKENALYPETDSNGTIHSLIYSAVLDSDGRVTTWQRNKSLKFDLLILDEASMIKADIWRDLLEYELPMLVFGDHGQLPPIGDNFNLMEKPMLKLEKIHRQAEGNPIIHVASLARQGLEIPYQTFSTHIKKMPRFSDEANDVLERYLMAINEETLLLCGSNKTRIQLNQKVRANRGIETLEPQVRDRVVCLKNKYDNKGGAIYNGMIGEITELKSEGEHWYQATIDFSEEGKLYKGKISKEQFNAEKVLDSVPGVHFSHIGDRFDFGYALTVHKAQGSQARRVVLFDESRLFREHAHRWLYTAITRAEEELYILG